MALQPLFIRGWKQLSAYEVNCGQGCLFLLSIENQ